MATPDVSKLTYAELIQLSKELDSQISAKRDEELKVLADGYIKKIQAAGFSVNEALQALAPYASKKSLPNASKTTPFVMYRDPANPENTWSGRGRPARWLASYESAGRKRDEFRV